MKRKKQIGAAQTAINQEADRTQEKRREKNEINNNFWFIYKDDDELYGSNWSCFFRI